MRIVLDTNVLVSALLHPNRTPAAVLNTALARRARLLHDNRILSEYRTVLGRSRFCFAPSDVAALMDFFEHSGEFIAATPQAVQLEDSADTPFYEVARSGGTDYLVTGNLRHYPEEEMIVSPAEFVQIVGSQSGR
jgi:putative PIN family toxin of toxin-antitoxin system